jgi:hypothetical protein
MRWLRDATGFAALACACSAAAQTPADFVGTYDGHQIELGTELRLEANGRFEYYLSYGAMDEIGQGRWAADADGIVLTSDPVKAPQFELVGTTPGKSARLDVTLDAPEQLPTQLFAALLLRPDKTAQEVHFDERGLHVPRASPNAPTAFLLGLPLYEVKSEPFDIPPGTKAMHFRFVPNDLGTVAFDHQRLKRDGDAFVLERFERTLMYRKEPPENPDEIRDGDEN